MTFEQWWKKHGQFCRAGGGDYEKTFAFRAWEFAMEAERKRCAKIAHSLGGDIDMNNPDDTKLCANSIEWEILGRPGTAKKTTTSKAPRKKAAKPLEANGTGTAKSAKRSAPR